MQFIAKLGRAKNNPPTQGDRLCVINKNNLQKLLNKDKRHLRLIKGQGRSPTNCVESMKNRKPPLHAKRISQRPLFQPLDTKPQPEANVALIEAVPFHIKYEPTYRSKLSLTNISRKSTRLL